MRPGIFINKAYRNAQNKSRFYVRVYINKRYVILPLNVYALPENYDQKTNRVKNEKDATRVNLILSEALGRAADIILKYQVNGKVLTPDLFKKEYHNPEVLCDFVNFMADEIKERSGTDLTESSTRQHFSTLQKFKEFRTNVKISEIDVEFLKNFYKFLKFKKKNNENTIRNALKNIRTYINIALKKELINESPFKNFKLKHVQTYPEHLTEDELGALKNLYCSGLLLNRYQSVLRHYLFSCETGLRISDLRTVKHEQIENNMLSFRPVKTINTTNKMVHVPLSNFAKRLILDEPGVKTKGLIFNCISEVRMNLYIKEAVKAARPKINKSISFHSARHTFATTFLRRVKQANGILILQKLLGHAKLESTLVYSHVLDDDIKDAIEQFSRSAPEN